MAMILSKNNIVIAMIQMTNGHKIRLSLPPEIEALFEGITETEGHICRPDSLILLGTFHRVS